MNDTREPLVEQVRRLLSDGQPRSKTAVAAELMGVRNDAKPLAVGRFIEVGLLQDSGLRINSRKDDPMSGNILYWWVGDADVEAAMREEFRPVPRPKREVSDAKLAWMVRELTERGYQVTAPTS